MRKLLIGQVNAAMGRVGLVVAVLLWAGFGAFAETRSGRAVAAPVTVYTQFDQDYSQTSYEEMRAELASIMEPIGFRFEWRSLAAARGNEVSVELVVVNFKGKCQAEDIPPHSGAIGALGWTHMSDGAVLPFSDVDCDRIREFIRPQLAAYHQEQRTRLLGRAMGRVLAHELYHVFASTTMHGAWYCEAVLYRGGVGFQRVPVRAEREQVVASWQSAATDASGTTPEFFHLRPVALAMGPA